MGNTQNKNLNPFSGEYQFDVLELECSSPRHSPVHNPAWNKRTFLCTQNHIQVSSGENDPEEILIDNIFQIKNEQPEDLIFTIQFHSSKTQEIRTWKIKSIDIHYFKAWKKFLRRLLKVQWKNTSHCQICDRNFSVFFRKHHCRKCLSCVCDRCSPFRSTLPELTYNKLVRICVNCSKGICERRKGEMGVEIPNFTLIKSRWTNKN